MRPEILFLSFGLFFIEDAFRYVVERSALLRKILSQYFTHNQPSVVRKIGSHLTWIHAQRFHIICSDRIKDNIATIENGELQHHKSDQELIYSTELDNKFKKMQEELMNIQSQVTKLLQAQEGRLLLVDENTENAVSSTTNAIPPPPPPMPAIPLMNPSSKSVKVETDIPASQNRSVNSIIEELSKKRPKLRHVQLTPGGRPKRLCPKSDDPADILLAVLKKRFSAMHSP